MASTATRTRRACGARSVDRAPVTICSSYFAIVSRVSWQPLLPPSYVQVANGLGVRLDELLARVDIHAHEGLEESLGGGAVLRVDTHQDPALGVHGRLPELIRVHLAQALVPLDLGFGALAV